MFSSSVKLQLQATSVGEVIIKGTCANRYLAMNRDGRLFGAVSELGCYVSIHTNSWIFSVPKPSSSTFCNIFWVGKQSADPAVLSDCRVTYSQQREIISLTLSQST